MSSRSSSSGCDWIGAAADSSSDVDWINESRVPEIFVCIVPAIPVVPVPAVPAIHCPALPAHTIARAREKLAAVRLKRATARASEFLEVALTGLTSSYRCPRRVAVKQNVVSVIPIRVHTHRTTHSPNPLTHQPTSVDLVHVGDSVRSIWL